MKAISNHLSAVSKSAFDFMLCAMLLALCAPAAAQQPKVSRIGYLSGNSSSFSAVRTDAFKCRVDRADKNMKRKITGLAVCALLSALCFSAEAQPNKIPFIGFLGGNSSSDLSPRVDGLKQGFRELGYVEGKNITIEYRFADGKVERLPDLAAELMRFKLDCIVTAGTPATRAAKQATGTIPIVMGNVDDPVGQRFAASLARPGGNTERIK